MRVMKLRAFFLPLFQYDRFSQRSRTPHIDVLCCLFELAALTRLQFTIEGTTKPEKWARSDFLHNPQPAQSLALGSDLACENMASKPESRLAHILLFSFLCYRLLKDRENPNSSCSSMLLLLQERMALLRL